MNAERIDLLILARLAGPIKKAPGPKVVRTDVGRYVAAHLSEGEWQAGFDDRVAALRARGDIVADKWAISDSGQVRVAQLLGMESVPEWRKVRQRCLPALALALEPGDADVRKRMGDADGIRSAVLQRTYALSGSRTPTAKQAMARLAWRVFGRETDASMSDSSVIAHALCRYLPEDSRGGRNKEKIFNLLAARSAGAMRSDPDSVRDALIAGWVGAPEGAVAPLARGVVLEPRPLTPSLPGAATSTPDESVEAPAISAPAPSEEAPAEAQTAIEAPVEASVEASAEAPIEVSVEAPIEAPPASAPESPAPTPVETFDLAGFAQVVREAAQHIPEGEGRFGPHKVFISAIWRQLESHALLAGMDVNTFKDHLAEANRQDLLALHRADLVTVMDPVSVAESEVHYGNAIYHFVERIPER